ncbi:MAG TPA: hypothetical protein VMW35_02310, partial [Myxococcota bacterium]|nr:hypothetical protein [Myxococcota bacterium]
YLGSSFGALFARPELPWKKDAASAEAVGERLARVEELLCDPTSGYLGWLREHGRYMSPNGAGDLLLAGAALLRNWVAVQLVLAVAVLGASLLLQLVRFGAAARAGGSEIAGLRVDEVLRLGWQAGGVWWSPWLLVPSATLALLALPAGWAYWLVPVRVDGARRFLALATVTFLLAVQIAALAGRPADLLAAVQWLGIAVTALALFVCGLAALVLRGRRSDDATAEGAAAARPASPASVMPSAMQSLLTKWLKTGLVLTAALAALGLVDSLAQTLYAELAGPGLGIALASLLATLGGLAAATQKIVSFFPSLAGDERPKVSWAALALVLALLLALVFLVSVSVAAHAIVWRGGAVAPEVSRYFAPCSAVAPPAASPWVEGLVAAALVSVLLNVAFARTWSFLNQSTQAPLYGARLRRAYLGASNPKRFAGGASGVSLEQEDDDLTLASYRPEERGGPLHLINVTVNETVEGRSQIEQRDRKGTSLAFGPAGLSLGVKHHAKWASSATRGSFASGLLPVTPARASATDCVFRVFEIDWNAPKQEPIKPESLSLGRLVAISGAAFSTGTGSRTSLGLSLLLGLLNVRLGHWWQSGVDPLWRSDVGMFPSALARAGFLFSRAFPVQRHLLDELLARFPGTARRNWYLSDGGHFENSAAYELIRRRLPLIVVADDGQDVDYAFEDLGQLVRKARLDFGAEIRFAGERELAQLHPWARHWIGTLAEIRGDAFDAASGAGGARRNHRHAALAFVYYRDAPHERGSLLLWIKPSLVGDEPRDVVEYALRSRAFPQETTADQFFDEAQWESYRALGETIGERLFGRPPEAGSGWLPRDLEAASWGVGSPAP